MESLWFNRALRIFARVMAETFDRIFKYYLGDDRILQMLFDQILDHITSIFSVFRENRREPAVILKAFFPDWYDDDHPSIYGKFALTNQRVEPELFNEGFAWPPALVAQELATRIQSERKKAWRLARLFEA